ncbi:TrbI/VirB10 family protein [Piscinibacter gummiphilus]|uniref:TrbI/VirB10 family protein n=1 Tax=Piscinibacter gummiphilus TaxID=946333 RepID=A0ABZ0D2V9_9BURK|nr:TrbI/VirB10 family protein [Piscinibacter gummiphilus]WOB11136.1 TrbI/VirB10 family protein [Piscinibacter gummiphilus]
MKLRERIEGSLASLSPRSKQWLTFGGIGAACVCILWLAMSSGTSDSPKKQTGPAPGDLKATNVELMAPGQQLSEKEVWIGKAGRELEQYKNDREEQKRINRERKETEADLMRRFAELEQKIRSTPTSPDAPKPAPALPSAPLPVPERTAQGAAPPQSSPAFPGSLPPAPGSLPARTGMPSGVPGPMDQGPVAAPLQQAVPSLVRVTLASKKEGDPVPSAGGQGKGSSTVQTIDNFLPVSFTRGRLLGGLDAPTGGQSQTNPHPVLIQLSDNSVLPNRFRAEYRECFVVAAGYGDISSERAYLRTESLSCVRHDGTALEVRIQGSVYGEDGKVGMRGRLVTKQGTMLANALLAGVVSGIGQGISTSSTTTATSALGQITTATGSDNFKAGVGVGVGRALDRLAQYYIKLAEQTFPVIEIDAGREIDVVITKGVQLDGGDTAKANASQTNQRYGDPADRYMKAVRDEED